MHNACILLLKLLDTYWTSCCYSFYANFIVLNIVFRLSTFNAFFFFLHFHPSPPSLAFSYRSCPVHLHQTRFNFLIIFTNHITLNPLME